MRDTTLIHACDLTLISMRNTTHWCVCADEQPCCMGWKDVRAILICDMSITLICDMTPSHLWHASFICVTCLLHACGMPHHKCDMPHSLTSSIDCSDERPCCMDRRDVCTRLLWSLSPFLSRCVCACLRVCVYACIKNIYGHFNPSCRSMWVHECVRVCACVHDFYCHYHSSCAYFYV